MKNQLTVSNRSGKKLGRYLNRRKEDAEWELSLSLLRSTQSLLSTLLVSVRLQLWLEYTSCLLIELPSLSISPSAVYRHLRTSCALSMKKLVKISVAKSSRYWMAHYSAILEFGFSIYYPVVFP